MRSSQMSRWRISMQLLPRRGKYVRLAGKLPSHPKPRQCCLLMADADWVRELAIKRGAWANEKQSLQSELL